MDFQQEVKDRVLELKKAGKAHRYIAHELSRSWPHQRGGTKRLRNWNDYDVGKIVKELEDEGLLPEGGATKFYKHVRSLPRSKRYK